MILAGIFFVLLAIEELVNESGTIKRTLMIIFSPILPVYTLLQKAIGNYKLETEISDTENYEEEVKRLTKISNQAHLIEVCTESSIQPLVQLFSIFAGLMDTFSENGTSELKVIIKAFHEKNYSEVG